MRIPRYIVLLAIICTTFFRTHLFCYSEDNIPVAAPMTTELAGRSGTIASASVFRIICLGKGVTGTAFLHRSGMFITAAHVVEGSEVSEIRLIGNTGEEVYVDSVIADTDLDLALLIPKSNINRQTLPISTEVEFSIGMQISAWGYPSGYSGFNPLLISGYLSGKDRMEMPSGKIVDRWVVNAAFNSGNSGGPLLDIETGDVVGVVSSKLAPLPPYIASALKALKTQKSGAVYSKTTPDGKTVNVSEAQVVEEVLQYLRSQTQLVIGYAVMIEDIRNFLKVNGVEP